MNRVHACKIPQYSPEIRPSAQEIIPGLDPLVNFEKRKEAKDSVVVKGGGCL